MSSYVLIEFLYLIGLIVSLMEEKKYYAPKLIAIFCIFLLGINQNLKCLLPQKYFDDNYVEFKEIAGIITETYEYMETLPNDKVRQQHLNKMEKYLTDKYTPKMKKLTRSQGQLLMKLVDRETHSSSYHIIDAFMGSFKAWSANLFAKLFGNDLKARYNPFGEDRVTERVCVLVEQGVV